MATTELGKKAEKLIKSMTPENVDQVMAEFERLVDEAKEDEIAIFEIQNAGESLAMYKDSLESK